MPCDERERMAELCRLFQDENESTRFDKLIEELGMLLEHSGHVEPARDTWGSTPATMQSPAPGSAVPDFRMECGAGVVFGYPFRLSMKTSGLPPTVAAAVILARRKKCS